MASTLNSKPQETPKTVSKEYRKNVKQIVKPQGENDASGGKTSSESFPSVGAVFTSSAEQTSAISRSTSLPIAPVAAVVPTAVVASILEQGFPALAKTTKPIPASVFSYRFASPTNNKTPYYISSDIVLSGGIAQKTRRRIVHNEDAQMMSQHVERRRKDKINGWITKLTEVVPGCSHGRQSKNLVLERSVDYLKEVNEKIQLLDEVQRGRYKLGVDNQRLRTQLEETQRQNKELRILLKKNDIQIPENLLSPTPQPVQQITATTNNSSKVSVMDVPMETMPSNTDVTWSTASTVAMATNSSDTPVPLETPSAVTEVMTVAQIPQNFPNTSPVIMSVYTQPQPSYSLHTVSSIMNAPSQGMVSLVPSSPSTDVNTVPIPVAITLPVVQASANTVASEGLVSVAVPYAHTVTSTDNAIPMIAQGMGSVDLSQAQGSLVPPSLQQPQVVTPISNQDLRPLNIPQKTGITLAISNPAIETQGLVTVNLPSSTIEMMRTSATPLCTQGLASVNVTQMPGVLVGPTNSTRPVQGIIGVNNPNSGLAILGVNANQTAAQSVVTVNVPQGPFATLGTGNACAAAPGIIALNNNPSIQTGTVGINAPSITIKRISALTIPGQAPLPVTNPTPTVSQGLVTVNVPCSQLRSANTSSLVAKNPQGLITLKVPGETPLPTVPCNPVASPVGFAPSPHTAFVIVRSTPSVPSTQQAICYAANGTRSSNSSQASQQMMLCYTSSATQSTPSSQQSLCYAGNATRGTPMGTLMQQSANSVPIVLNDLNFQTGTTQLPLTLNVETNLASIGVTRAQPQASTVTKRSITMATTAAATVQSTDQPPTKTSKPFTPSARARSSSKKATSSVRSEGKTKSTVQSKTKQRSRTPARLQNSPFNPIEQPSGSNSAERSSAESSVTMDICQQEDMLSIQNFSISSLIPCIDSQTTAPVTLKASSPLNSKVVSRDSGGVVVAQPASNARLSYSIESLTGIQGMEQGGQGETPGVHQHQSQHNGLSFSAESLLNSGEDLLHSIPPITSSSVANQSLNVQNSFNVATYQDSSVDASSHQGFSNFSAEALIGASELMAMSSDLPATACSQGAQSTKQTHSRTQMFSDFSAESLINSSDLGSGLSYAIDNLIARSVSSYNSSAMVTVNPNLIHNVTTNIAQDGNLSTIPLREMQAATMQEAAEHKSQGSGSSAATNGNLLTQPCNPATQPSFSTFSYSSPQKQYKETYTYRPNGTVVYNGRSSSSSTSPTYLKHSVDNITSSIYGTVSSAPGAPVGTPLSNSVTSGQYTSLFPMEQTSTPQYVGNSFTLTGNINRNFHGPTMGSFA